VTRRNGDLMADLLSEPIFYIVLIVLVVLSVVVYFEVKYLRRKRFERAEAKAKVDDVYNQIITTRAVSNAIKGQGKSTKEADLAILEADTAFSRGSYTEAKGSVERAKDLLRMAKEQQEPPKKIDPQPKQSKDKPTEVCEVPFQETKKMPKNFLESKFMICSVKDEVEASARAGTDVSMARDNLRMAEDAFAREDYTEALKGALRARKSLEGGETQAKERTVIKELPSVETVPAAVVLKPNLSKCEKCSNELNPDDMFCPRCGARIERDIRCPRCANKVKVDDAFCRKCGLPLRSD
jgi:hypothetical protein